MKYSCCDVASPVSKHKIIGAGLKLRVRELDVHIIDINAGCSGLWFLGDIIFGATVGSLGTEGVERPIKSNLESICATFGNIVGDPIIIHISLGLTKFFVLIV